MVQLTFQNKRPAAIYLNLTAQAWAQLRRSWAVPTTVSLLRQAYLAGPVRSLIAGLQSLVVGGSRQKASDAEAIFILGFWRSGTTLLHELLCADDRFAFPSTHACFFPHHFVFSEKFALARNAAEIRRPQDRMATSWGAPQEDEFALLCLGARSPYEGLIAAGDFGKALQLADPSDLPAKDASRWEKIFLQFFRAVWHRNGRKPVVLKSPSHSYRVRTLRRLVPNARFVLIVRNPYEVFESMMKTYRAFSLRYGLVPGLPNRELREVILTERLRCEEKLQSGLAGLGSDKLAVVKYEDLIADPVGTVEAIYRQFGLPDFEAVRSKLMQKGERVGAKAAAQPPPQWRERVKAAWSGIFERYGYDPGL
jgi:omega-hydroxy-beta-dihydromenaquinone-9 sulfotransferase